MKRILLSAAIAVIAIFSGMAQSSIKLATTLNVIENGDLLFVASPVENGITSVTEGIDGIAIDHVAIAHRDTAGSGKLTVIEAIGKGVCVTPIDSFMANATPKSGTKPLVLVGRLEDRSNATTWIANAMKYVGRPYDHLFMHDDQEIYCSELVMLSYVDKNGKPIFAPIRMSFHDKSGNVTEFWRKYYAKYGLCVPEGAQGSNPGQLSRDSKVKIIYRYF